MHDMHKERVLSLEDLRFVRITCRHCNTRVTLDLNTKTGVFAPPFPPPNHQTFPPEECPVCHEKFDSAVSNLGGLHQLYGKLIPLKGIIGFHGEPVDEDTPGASSKADS
jgi:hypothetical protein